MSINYQVPQLSPNDFTTDFEDLLIQYLYDRWSISSPGRDPLGKVGLDGTKVQFRPGFPDYSKPFEILCLQTGTRVANRNDPFSYHFFTQMEIRIVRSYEMERDNISVELGNMEREVERIINTYSARPLNQQIAGIDDIIYLGRQRDYGNISGNLATSRRNVASATRVNSSASWAISTWESVTMCELSYYKEVV